MLSKQRAFSPYKFNILAESAGKHVQRVNSEVEATGFYLCHVFSVQTLFLLYLQEFICTNLIRINNPNIPFFVNENGQSAKGQ